MGGGRAPDDRKMVPVTGVRQLPWRIPPPDPEALSLAAALGVHPLVAAILRRRGVTTPEEAREFLDPRLDRLTDPLAFPGMQEAVDAVGEAIRSGRPLAIHGDYDVDGIAATAILVRGLRAVGADPLWYLPHRLRDGYGLGVNAVDALADRGARLLLAADCGITAHAAVERAAERGLTVVVLDHHTPPAERPPALIVDPGGRKEGAPPCAAGLALFFLWALYRHLGHAHRVPEELAVLAALGTVADVVPLRGDNRRLVAAGLARLRDAPIPGLRTLVEVSGIQGPVGVWHVGWQLAPRLNAPGRLGDPTPALRLLLTDDPAEAHDLAWALDAANRERQAITDRVLEEAIAQAESDGGSPAVVAAGKGWHPGVVGLVAGRLVELYDRPAVVIALDEAAGRGSARSVEGFDLVDALALCRDSLLSFGGHSMAAGLSIAPEAVEDFRRAFFRVAAERLVREPVRLDVDAEVRLPELSVDLVAQLDRLGPFGVGNPAPVLVARGVRTVAGRLVGNGEHLSLTVTDGSAVVDAIGFQLGPWIDLLTLTEARVDVAFVPEVDRAAPERVRLRVRALDVPGLDPGAVLANTELLVDRLFARASDFLGRPSYGGVEQAAQLYTKLVGVTFDARQEAISSVRPGDPLRLRREPGNPHDPHAIQVTTGDGRLLGYLNARLAGRLAPAVDRGARYRVTVAAVTGTAPTQGVNVYLERDEEAAPSSGAAARRRAWGVLARRDAMDRLAIELLGGRPIPPSWAEACEVLEERGAVVLAVPPGRGRVGALATVAAMAVRWRRPVLVVANLPAHVRHRADQLRERLGPLGLTVVAVHGLQGLRERQEVARSLRAGEADVVVASVEACLDLLRRGEGEGGVLVLDGVAEEDARRVAALRARPLAAVGSAGSASVLARAFGAPVLVDYRARPPLQVADLRGEPGRVDLLVEEIALDKEKALFYTVQREACVRLAARLREASGGDAGRVAYLHGGLPASLRRTITQAFRAGRLRVLVTTGAADEEAVGPEVRRLVVAELPPDRDRFTALCGAAGAGARPVTVTLAYGGEEIADFRRRVEERAPGRETLLALYHALRAWRGSEPFPWPDAEVWDHLSRAVPGLSPSTVWAACAVFEELGLASRESLPGGGGWQVQMQAAQGRRSLRESLRYREGLRERRAFEGFAEWAERAGPPEVLRALLA
jgi:single-stranded-DNA-specific exonuclease